MLGGLELLQLRKLGDLPFRLFLELLAMADHATGRIVTSYAVLLALLDFDQAPCAHAADKPTPRRVRTALEHLLELGLVRLDRIKNEKDKGLFLKVQPRGRISAPEGMKGRLSDRPEKPAKRATARPAAFSFVDERQTERQGVQEDSLTPLPPLLSTAGASNPVPPRGHDKRADARTPPTGETATTRAMKARIALRKAKDEARERAGELEASSAPAAAPGRTGTRTPSRG